MKKTKFVSLGLVTAIMITSACVLGVSAASAPSSNTSSTSAISNSSINATTSTSKISPAQRALFQKYYKDALADANKNSEVSNAVITPEFNYGPMGGPSIDTIVFTDKGLVQEGDVGFAVYQLQCYINDIFWSNINQDGYFGSQTYAGVIAFQEWWNSYYPANLALSVDGIVGSNTLKDIEHVMSGE